MKELTASKILSESTRFFPGIVRFVKVTSEIYKLQTEFTSRMPKFTSSLRKSKVGSRILKGANGNQEI